jgi:DNA-directed RNA polymerase subunit RPC12/RpoP
MTYLPPVSCAYCKKYVKPIQGISIYRCAECGRAFSPSQIAAALDLFDRAQQAPDLQNAELPACASRHNHE